MQSTLPQTSGMKVVETTKKIDTPGYSKLRFSNAVTLKDLSLEYAFFTHAALFVYGNWPHDPVFDYIAKEDPTCDAFWLEFNDPIFSGLDFKDKRRRRNSEWNYRLMACPVGSWQGLLKFFMELQGFSPKDHRYYRTILQKIPMTDHYALGKKSILPIPIPTIDLYTIGLDGNDKQVYFEPAINPPLDKVKVRLLPPEQSTVELGEKILSFNVKPLLASPEKEEANVLSK